LAAVKAFHTRDAGRARNEEAILQLLGPHPFVPRLLSSFSSSSCSDPHSYGFGYGDGFHFLALEFCPGGDLHDLRSSLPDRRFSPSAIR
jgi:serine/threonine protein kinase